MELGHSSHFGQHRRQAVSDRRRHCQRDARRPQKNEERICAGTRSLGPFFICFAVTNNSSPSAAKKAKKVPALGVIRLRKLASDTGGPGFLMPAIKCTRYIRDMVNSQRGARPGSLGVFLSRLVITLHTVRRTRQTCLLHTHPHMTLGQQKKATFM